MYTMYQVSAVIEGDIAIQVVPNVEFPLEPHTCMCQSMDTVSSITNFSGVETGQFQYTCVTGADCLGIVCNVTTQQVTALSIQFAVDPCSEVLMLNSRAAGAGKTDLVVFNETKSRPFTVGGFAVTVHVKLEHHNYSMDIQVRLCRVWGG